MGIFELIKSAIFIFIALVVQIFFWFSFLLAINKNVFFIAFGIVYVEMFYEIFFGTLDYLNKIIPSKSSKKRRRFQ